MKLLVLGGAGYVGSHFVHYASRQGHICRVVDNLSRGHRQAVPATVALDVVDLRETDKLAAVVADFTPDVVLHYAALALVSESVSHPDLYFDNNVKGTESLLAALRAAKCNAPLVFSSSCVVYGTPQRLPIVESDLKSPQSPYGESKLACEKLLADYSARFNVPVIALRYFNACGAAEDGRLGEAHDPETHLIPNLLLAALQNRQVTIFGNDFATHDGTCVRDYVHVQDLAESHLVAASILRQAAHGHRTFGFQAMNLGTGRGYSNLEILRAVERVLGRSLQFKFGPRRPGDPPALFADNSLVKQRLGFQPKHSDLDTIIRTAWAWHQKHPQGYPTL